MNTNPNDIPLAATIASIDPGANAQALRHRDEAVHERSRILGARRHVVDPLTMTQIGTEPVLRGSVGRFHRAWVHDCILELDESIL